MSSALRINASTKYNTSDRPFIGDTKQSAINTDHGGWLLCNGRALDKARFPLLFNTIGYSFGGSGDSFNLPDARGRVTSAIGPDGNGIDGDQTWVQGAIAGTQRETIDICEMPSHTHTISDAFTGISGTNSATTGIIINSAGAHTHTVGNTILINSRFTATETDDTDPSPEDEINLHATTTTTTSVSGEHTHTISDSGHIHTITDPGHNHIAAHTGGDVPINIMQPTIFIGNVFMYGGNAINKDRGYLQRSTHYFV